MLPVVMKQKVFFPLISQSMGMVASKTYSVPSCSTYARWLTDALASRTCPFNVTLT